MKLLSKITPAETVLIQLGSNAELKTLIKYTFLDLLLKKVIKVVEIGKKTHPMDDIRMYTYIELGKNFEKYTPKNHEAIFLNPFREDTSIQVLFNHFVKIIYDASGGKKSYRESVRSNKQMKSYFNQSFFVHLFRLTRLTDKGKKVKEEITTYLQEANNKINDLLHNDKEKALELLLNIGGNIFLLQNLDFELLKKIDEELLNQKRSLISDSYASGDDWYFYLDFFEDGTLFDFDFEEGDSFDSHFDSTMDSFDTEFDASSCSSWDSGCSGCGGCD